MRHSRVRVLLEVLLWTALVTLPVPVLGFSGAHPILISSLSTPSAYSNSRTKSRSSTFQKRDSKLIMSLSIKMNDEKDDTADHRHGEDGSKLHRNDDDGFADGSSQSPHSTLWSCRRDLWTMCRPSNFPGVFLFHTLGVWLAMMTTSGGMTLSTTTTSSVPTTRLLLQTLANPQMLLVLLSLLLTSSTSMLVNDYYDNRSGVDASKSLEKPLVSGRVSSSLVRRFLSILYATILLTVCVIPGVPARLSVTIGVMLTYSYTQHLKPLTWWKNVVCAVLIALSPMTSGASAYHLMLQRQQVEVASSIASWRVLGIPSLLRLVSTLFMGFFGREVLMDINDRKDDRLQGVQTIPVRHGRKYASRVALLSTIGTGLIAVGGPLYAMIMEAKRDMFWWKTAVSRRMLLAIFGSGAMVYRAWQVYQDGGQDKETVDRAVEEGKLTVLLILASFV